MCWSLLLRGMDHAKAAKHITTHTTATAAVLLLIFFFRQCKNQKNETCFFLFFLR
jgi:hypothetical protein